MRGRRGVAVVTTLVTRAQWMARPPQPGIGGITPTFGETIHYEGGSGLNLTDHARCASAVRGIQRYHMDVRGWLDIAYTRLACPHDYVYEGRGPGKRTAANGTDEGNAAAYAVCALIDTDDPITQGLLNALAWACWDLDAHGGGGPGINGHRDWKPTACPRDDLYGLIPEIDRRRDLLAHPTPDPVPSPTLPEADPVILFPSFVPPRPNGRRAFYELRTVDADTFRVVSFNDAPLKEITGTSPSGQWFMDVNATTGAALGIGEHQGAAVVACQNGGTYQINP